MTFSAALLAPRRVCVFAAVVLAGVAALRIFSSYADTAQAFDEPCHVAAAMELLDRHRYTLDPIHPPLARIAIGFPLYLAGERYPTLPANGDVITYNEVGNAVLSGSGHYLRNLKLARLGVLPFFLLATAIVFLWARREYGDLAAAMAAALFTTLPNVLAFSSIAYTDIVAAATQVLLLFAFCRWLAKPTQRSALCMGLVAGLALASKATTVMFFPVGVAGIVLVKWLSTRTLIGDSATPAKTVLRQIAFALALAGVTIWATYGFAIGHISDELNLSSGSAPSFQHFPAPVARAGRWLISTDPLVPAPALIKAVGDAWVLNQSRPPAYLLGQIRPGGWWYFFLVGVAVKAPMPFLVLAGVGTFSFRACDPAKRWRQMAPALAAVAVLLITTTVKYNAGVRHVLIVFPLLAIVAGRGCAFLWQRKRVAPCVGLIALLGWQVVSTAKANGDFLAYFNELAGSDPSKILVAGCDLDCGQDLFRLAREFQARQISHATIAVWTSAEPSLLNLPPFGVPEANRPVTGWFAISLRALRFGDSFHTTYPPGAFRWLNAYQPVSRVGQTILLYYIPEDGRPGVP